MNIVPSSGKKISTFPTPYLTLKTKRNFFSSVSSTDQTAMFKLIMYQTNMDRWRVWVELRISNTTFHQQETENPRRYLSC